jgi:hypothetical protein
LSWIGSRETEAAVGVRSDGSGEFGERGRDAAMGADGAPKFVVAATDVRSDRPRRSPNRHHTSRGSPRALTATASLAPSAVSAGSSAVTCVDSGSWHANFARSETTRSIPSSSRRWRWTHVNTCATCVSSSASRAGDDTLRHDLLDRTLVWNERRLHTPLNEYVDDDNTHRPQPRA